MYTCNLIQGFAHYLNALKTVTYEGNLKNVICTKIADSTVDSKEVVVIKLSYIYEHIVY